MKTIIATERAPRAIGPYSQAVRAGNTLFVSGQIALDPATMEIAGSTAPEQAERALKNISAILEEAGFSMGDVVKTTVYLKEIGDFAGVNEVYAGYFTGEYPARAAFAVAALPRNALVEIEAVAVKD
jgi:2-iminobutanoate/2-iminopropanoate deaminase